jgi:hypothetical protein
VKVADIEDEEVDAATLNHNFTNPTFNHTIPTFNHTKPTWNFTKPTKPTPQPKPFRSMVNKRIARNESTTTITVADINGGNVKVPTFFGSPDLATLTSAAASKWSWATVGFNATASATSFTVTVNNRKPINWVTVSTDDCVAVLLKQLQGCFTDCRLLAAIVFVVFTQRRRALSHDLYVSGC